MARRLRDFGIKRCDAPMDGNCMFVALRVTSGLSARPQELRQQVVAYMKANRVLFQNSFDTTFGNFNSYLDHMGQDGSYGDDCCLTCAAHILRRKIKVVCANPEHDREFLPPKSVSPVSNWHKSIVRCDDLYLAFVAWNHYEATAPFQKLHSRQLKEKRFN